MRAAVLDAALLVLVERGPDRAGVAEIAQRAGVHETSIYRRWGTREALLLDAMTTRAEQALPIPDTGSLHRDLVQLLERVIAFLQSPLGAGLARVSAAVPVGGPLDEARRTYWAQRLDHAHGIIRRAIARGELPADADAALVLDTLLGPLYLRLLVTGEPLEPTLPRRLVGLLLAGLVRPEPKQDGTPGQASEHRPDW